MRQGKPMEEAVKRPFSFCLMGVLSLLLAFSVPGMVRGQIPNQERQPRPIPLGVSGGNINDQTSEFCCGGTLGALVSFQGQLYILSNNHVLARTNLATLGEGISQPGLIDETPACQVNPGDVVATLGGFLPIDFTSQNTMDVAGALIIPGDVDPSGSILGIGPPSSQTVAPSIGMRVKKSGRTTGVTHGVIRAINVTVNVGYPTECGSQTIQTAQFVNQMMIIGRPIFIPFSKAGDSGALIVEDVGTCPRPVGLLFAGGMFVTLANPLDLLAQSGASFVGCESPSSAPSNIGESAVNEQELRVVKAVQERHTEALMRIPGVVGVGIGRVAGTGRAVIEVYLEKAAPELEQALPQALEGILVKKVVTGKIMALGCPASSQGAALAGGSEVEEREIAAAKAVQERHTEALMRIPGVVGTGIGWDEEIGR
ncbi:MAG: hypothetical protein ACK4Z6_07630, partial [Candidatus Methylomirabilales bacterium]